jgi:hypothetical protein
VDEGGTYIFDHQQRTASGLIALTVDDATPPTDNFAIMADGAVLQASRNVGGQDVFRLSKAQLQMWDTQLGSNGPHCAQGTGIAACGLWVGQYLLHDGVTPVANAQPTRPGDNPDPSAVFCFGADRTMITTNKVSTATGLCGISPDNVENHSGACATGGCMCGASACTPQPVFPAIVGGTAPGAVFYEPFTAN